MIGVIDFGSQYTQLIARRVRECGVYSEIFSCFIGKKALSRVNMEGMILSGGPGSVYASRPMRFKHFFTRGVPVLGICFGMQLVAELAGGKVKRSSRREYGHARVRLSRSLLFRGLPAQINAWMSHGDQVVKVPRNVKTIASTDSTPVAGIQWHNVYGLQFHPEVQHTEHGAQILDNFLTEICRARKNWSMKRFIDDEIKKIKETVGRSKVICAVSGGIDSTVAAALTSRAIGKNLVGIFVDNGLLRHEEREEVERALRPRLNLRVIQAQHRFLSCLRRVKAPERKRKIIGREFVRIFEKEARKITQVKYLVQGTLYPDVIESGKGVGPSSVIKSHHNVGGLPRRMKLKVIEPLRMLFKDEVRKIAQVLKLPSSFVQRKPFPGPGLAVRIVGPVTKKRLDMLRHADRILYEEARSISSYDDIWQVFAVLLPLGSVGVMGDSRTYDYVCAVRAVSSEDGMTADWVRIPHDVLARISRRITNEVKGINRVVFDITSKPPSTIEWE